MLFNINEKAKIMTREEFLNEIEIEREAHFIKFFNAKSSEKTGNFSCIDVCPSIYGLKEYCSNYSSETCKECWMKAIEPIRFKDETK